MSDYPRLRAEAKKVRVASWAAPEEKRTARALLAALDLSERLLPAVESRGMPLDSVSTHRLMLLASLEAEAGE